MARPRAIGRAIRTARHLLLPTLACHLLLPTLACHLLRPTLACRLSDFEQFCAARFHVLHDGLVHPRRVADRPFGDLCRICGQARHHLSARRPLVAQPPRDLGSVRASWRKRAHTIVDSSSRLGYDRAWLGHGAGSRASLAIGIIAWCVLTRVITFDARLGLPRLGVVGDESGPHRGCRRARLGRGHPGRGGTTAAGAGALSRSCAGADGLPHRRRDAAARAAARANQQHDKDQFGLGFRGSRPRRSLSPCRRGERRKQSVSAAAAWADAHAWMGPSRPDRVSHRYMRHPDGRIARAAHLGRGRPDWTVMDGLGQGLGKPCPEGSAGVRRLVSGGCRKKGLCSGRRLTSVLRARAHPPRRPYSGSCNGSSELNTPGGSEPHTKVTRGCSIRVEQ